MFLNLFYIFIFTLFDFKFMLYENFYFVVSTRHSADKIWSSICIQDNLYSIYCILYIIRLIGCD